MAQLIVRGLEDDLVARLKQRAAKSGRSMEAEHRELLRKALLGSDRRKSLKQHLLDMPDEGRDADFVLQQDKGRTVRL